MKYANEYKHFFVDSEAGRYFMEFLSDREIAEIDKSIREPESSRDCMQRVAGIREALDHIDSMCLKKGTADK